jgi:hypothetical protein
MRRFNILSLAGREKLVGTERDDTVVVYAPGRILLSQWVHRREFLRP